MTTDRRSSGARTAEQEKVGRRAHAGVRRALAALAAAALGLAALAPAAFAAEPLVISTPYPAVVVAPGAHVSFNVTVTTAAATRVALSLSDAPVSWNASLHGGGFVVDALETNGTDPVTVRVDLDVPGDATGTTAMTLRGTAGSDTAELALAVRVEANATGDVTLKTDFPSLKGPSTQTFNFNLTLSNGTPEDLTFSVNAQGPTGWTVQANLTGQAQAASAVVKAGTTSGVTVSAIPPVGVAADTYELRVVALAGERTIQGALSVEVTGTYTLSMDTSDGRLNGHGPSGTSSPLSIVLTNDGTADITNVTLSASSPREWEVTFDQANIDAIAAGQSVTVIASVKPTGDAIAGDYTVTISASGDLSARDQVEIRYTVETSVVWGVVGVALIVAVGGAIWWVFQRYGRR